MVFVAIKNTTIYISMTSKKVLSEMKDVCVGGPVNSWMWIYVLHYVELLKIVGIVSKKQNELR